MKAASAGLISLLNSGTAFFMADLYTFTLVGGTVLRYTNYDIALVLSGNTFSVLPIKRGAIREQVGINVEQLQISVYADANNQINSTAFLTAAAQGALDGARLRMERVFMPTIGDTSLGTLIRFLGRVSDIIVSRTTAQITVKSDLELLNIQMPRNLYQPGCVHTLFDAGCTLVKANFGVTGTVSAGATASVIPCSLANANGYFDLGTVSFTSGANNGVSRSVKSYTVGNLVLSRPLLAVPANGDTLTAYPGDDKTQSTCTNKFNNLANFRGYPYIPRPETVF